MFDKIPRRFTKLGEYRAKLYKKITWIIYLVECQDGTYFGGMTKNLAKDIHLINNYRKGKYFSCNPERVPVKLIYKEHVPFKEANAKFTYLKKMNHRLREKLVTTNRWPYGGAWKEFAEKNPRYLEVKRC